MSTLFQNSPAQEKSNSRVQIFQLSFVTSLKGTPQVTFGHPVTG
jgi:hypothetical protein